MTENKKLQARVVALEQSRTPMKVSQIIDRLDNVIQVVNTHATESYHLEQSVQDIQQELISLRQTVDSWNDDQEANGEEQQEIPSHDDLPDPPLHEDQELPQDTPPGLGGSGNCFDASLNWWAGICSLSSRVGLSYPPICNGGSGGLPRFRNMP